MSQLVPTSRDDMLTFYSNHIESWENNALLIGISAPAATALKSAIDAALAQLAATQQARETARALTDQLNDKAALVRSLGGAALASIRAFAVSTDNPAVYELANIPMPQPPVPYGPPIPPTNLVADPTANGTIILTWKGTTANSQFFVIERSVDGGPWVRLEPVGAKKYIDEFVPRNSNTIQYQVWAARFDERAETAPQATVNFGTVDPAILAAFRSGGEGTALAA